MKGDLCLTTVMSTSLIFCCGGKKEVDRSSILILNVQLTQQNKLYKEFSDQLTQQKDDMISMSQKQGSL